MTNFITIWNKNITTGYLKPETNNYFDATKIEDFIEKPQNNVQLTPSIYRCRKSKIYDAIELCYFLHKQS